MVVMVFVIWLGYGGWWVAFGYELVGILLKGKSRSWMLILGFFIMYFIFLRIGVFARQIFF